jgi:hypothetical protein
MTQQQIENSLPPLVKRVTVPLSVEQAFRRFTEQMATWWPMETHSVGEKDTESVAFEGQVGGRIFETLRSGDTSVWGTVLVWEPFGRVVFTWHPGREPSSAQEVEVRFSAVDDQTEVVVTHRGWETLGDEASQMRSGYDKGWDFVLGRFVG